MKINSAYYILLLLFAFSACTNENVEEDFMTGPCDITSATYSLDVLPLMRDYCYRCHGTDTRFGGVFLEGYSNVASYAKNDILGHVLRGTDGFTIMPNDGVLMPECDILTIEQWIAEGAENN